MTKKSAKKLLCNKAHKDKHIPRRTRNFWYDAIEDSRIGECRRQTIGDLKELLFVLRSS